MSFSLLLMELELVVRKGRLPVSLGGLYSLNLCEGDASMVSAA